MSYRTKLKPLTHSAERFSSYELRLLQRGSVGGFSLVRRPLTNPLTKPLVRGSSLVQAAAERL
jgi:hypothetical protein